MTWSVISFVFFFVVVVVVVVFLAVKIRILLLIHESNDHIHVKTASIHDEYTCSARRFNHFPTMQNSAR